MNHELVFVGLVIALLTAELGGFLPGGLVVPAFAALYAHQPLRLAGSLASGLLALASYRLLSRFLILFGRRRFVMLVLFGASWSFILSRLLALIADGAAPGVFPPGGEALAALLPGLLANSFERQGIWITLAAAAAATGLTLLAGRLLGLA